ncbi:MAG: hypothetical protein WEA75_12650 [Acidimicrobiia bacterium]
MRASTQHRARVEVFAVVENLHLRAAGGDAVVGRGDRASRLAGAFRKGHDDAVEVRVAVVGEEELHGSARRDVVHRPLDDVERGGLVVRHLQRATETSLEIAPVGVSSHHALLRGVLRTGVHALGLGHAGDQEEQWDRERQRESRGDEGAEEAFERREDQLREAGTDQVGEPDHDEAAHARATGGVHDLFARGSPIRVGDHDLLVLAHDLTSWCWPNPRRSSASPRPV